MSSPTPTSVNVDRLREDFPILERELGENIPLVYLDNAATSQTPN